MKLTKEQFEALQPYKKHFETMVHSHWTRHPGSAALDLINDIYSQVVGHKTNLNKGCSQCIMQLMEDMGRIFLADLEEREKVEVKEILTTEPVKVEVTAEKPKRKYTRKPKVTE